MAYAHKLKRKKEKEIKGVNGKGIVVVIKATYQNYNRTNRKF